ncbi:XrtA-associated tyrosine autokinase [Aestuariirhabdus sp. LZHN29]|uniref:XrtA-associated tyrosine autokinase n=1 Tax=Aestuariirhabdus sp. LZHN29 TaxID=3417462 RepID=UPI003CF1AADF
MDTIEKALRKGSEGKTQSATLPLSEDCGMPKVEDGTVEKSVSGVGLSSKNKNVEYPRNKHAETRAVVPGGAGGISSGDDVAISSDSKMGDFITIKNELLKSKNIMVPSEDRSLIKEQYRHLKRSILGKAFGSDNAVKRKLSNLVMVTSASPREGKTFTTLNLALSIALEQDRKILLVDADVVQPSINSVLEIDSSLGIVDYLNSDEIEFENILHKTSVDNLSLVLAGSRHHLTNELLASESMRALMNELSTRYPDRIVMLDTPPLCLTTEAAILASLVGQVIVVVEEGTTTQRRLKEALGLIGDHPDVSLLMNKCSSAKEGSYYGYY